MKNYGVPYVGSKSRIAKWLIEQLPAAPVLVDAFAGGCAITHAALESGKFDRVISNFYDWCVDISKTNRVFVSEYSIEDPRFVVVAQKDKLCSLCSTGSKIVIEKFFTVKT